MTAQTVDVIAELEQRAGASDEDRAAWLMQRRAGVTATEIRDLLVKGPSFKEELIQKKLGLVADDFAGNAYTAWGKEREPVIAAIVHAEHGIRPESRVFHAERQPRWLASPDGLGVDWDGLLVGQESKTSGHDIAPGSKKFVEVGYLFQIIWCMRVTGARRWLYVWEPRIGSPAEGFFPGELRWEWIEYDETIARTLEAVAVDFLDSLDAARAALQAGEGPVIDEVVDTLALNYLEAARVEKQGAEAKKAAYDALKTHLASGEPFAQRSLLANVSMSADRVEVVADEAAARADDPEGLFDELNQLNEERARVSARVDELLARHMTKERVVKGKLTVTAAKTTKKEKDA